MDAHTPGRQIEPTRVEVGVGVGTRGTWTGKNNKSPTESLPGDHEGPVERLQVSRLGILLGVRVMGQDVYPSTPSLVGSGRGGVRRVDTLSECRDRSLPVSLVTVRPREVSERPS